MTHQEEEAIIHQVLVHLLNNIGGPFYLPEVLTKVGFDDNKYISPILVRLMANGMVKQIQAGQVYVLQLTAKGIDVARHPGGYNGYLEEQAQRQQQEVSIQREKDNREQELARAAIDGVRANWWAVRVSIVGLLIGIVFSVLAQIQSNDTADELEIAKQQIHLLQQQVKKFATPK